jgi:CubicO group peptidase (beta-lactamase class C family)
MRPRTAAPRACLLLALALPAGAQEAAPQATPPPAASGAAIAEHPRVKQALAATATWLEAQWAYEQIPGVSAAIVHDQQVLWSGAWGLAERETRRPARVDTLYSICSISKLFTSLATMQQRDAGALRLDDPLVRHLPWFALAKTEGEGEVTIEGLLTHASGLPRESDHAYWTGPGFEFPTREQVRERLSGQVPLYPPETYFQYSNLGMALLGEVVGAAAGEPYDRYVRRSILDPLGLGSTYPEMPAEERGKRLAVGYSALDREGRRAPVAFFQARGIAPAAGFASTALDLAAFAAWHFRLRASGGTEVVKATTLREMQRIHWADPDMESRWGLGYALWRSDNQSFVGHDGSCPGFRTSLLMNNDQRLATVFMANAQGVNANRFSQQMHDLVAPAVKAAAKETGAPKAADAGLERYRGVYASGFAGEVAVFPWEDGLGMISLPNAEPARGITKLKPAGEHVFRRLRSDEKLGEEIVFELGNDGRAKSFRRHYNVFSRTRTN